MYIFEEFLWVIPDLHIDLWDYLVDKEKEYKTLQAMATDGLTRKEMAEIVGVSESALCGLRNRVFNKIRKNL